MMLIELSAVKSRLNTPDSVDDTLLIHFIEMVSGRFELFCNRKFERTANDTFEFQADGTEIIPERLPIESVAGFDLKTDEAEGWVPQTVTDFVVRRKGVISLRTQLGVEGDLARVTYTAGFVLPGTTPGVGQTALPPEIAGACVEQVAYLYQNRDRLGLISVAGQGGAIQQFAQLDLLPFVKEVLRKHERYLL